MAKIYGKKKFYRKKKKGNKLATVKVVKRMINHSKETMYFQGQLTPTAIDSTGIIYQLNSISQGVDEGQRKGDQITHKSLDLRFTITNNQVSFARVRCILLWYRQETSASPIASDILAQVSTANAIVSTYNMRSEGAYQILYDKVFAVTSGSATVNVNGYSAVGGSPCVQAHCKKRLKDKLGQYTGASGSDLMTKGYLGWLVISDIATAAASTTKPIICFHYTLKYTDS